MMNFICFLQIFVVIMILTLSGQGFTTTTVSRKNWQKRQGMNTRKN